MSGLFGVPISDIILGALGGQLQAVTLHKVTETVDEYGAPSRTFADHSGEGVRLKWDSQTAIARGYPADAVKILMLQNGVTEPGKGDELTVLSERWRVLDIRKDPVDATWTIAGVPA